MSKFSNNLIKWYQKNARKLIWRKLPNTKHNNPYHVWVAEIMLQQTTTKTVEPYFGEFIKKFKNIQDVANASQKDVMKLWAGLGYYSRARNLKKCAEVITKKYENKMPDSVEELKKLPGIGDYTANAIVAIAFNKKAAPVDGNIQRVTSRVTMNKKVKEKQKSDAKKFMEEHTPEDRPSDFIQAMMDLGATICTPKNPRCGECPVSRQCEAKKYGKQEEYPTKQKKPKKPVRKGAAFVAVRKDGAVWLTTQKKSLLKGTSGVPTTEWSSKKDGKVGVSGAPFEANWENCGEVTHTFTHFGLILKIWKTENVGSRTPKGDGWWSKPNQLKDEALSSLTKKVVSKTKPNEIV